MYGIAIAVRVFSFFSSECFTVCQIADERLLGYSPLCVGNRQGIKGDSGYSIECSVDRIQEDGPGIPCKSYLTRLFTDQEGTPEPDVLSP